MSSQVKIACQISRPRTLPRWSPISAHVAHSFPLPWRLPTPTLMGASHHFRRNRTHRVIPPSRVPPKIYSRVQRRKFSEQQTNSHEDNVPRKSAELMPHRRTFRRPEQGFHLKTTTKEKLHGDASNVENDVCRRSRCDITTLKQTISLTRIITGRHYRRGRHYRSNNTNNTSHT
jgi:hypothetical protein